MFEAWLEWRYKRYEQKKAAADDFEEFEQWASGPWTPSIAARMPWRKLLEGPQLGNIDPETRRVIDLEIERRYRSRQPEIANFISVISLAVAIVALIRTS